MFNEIKTNLLKRQNGSHYFDDKHYGAYETKETSFIIEQQDHARGLQIYKIRRVEISYGWKAN